MENRESKYQRPTLEIVQYAPTEDILAVSGDPEPGKNTTPVLPFQSKGILG